MGISFKQAAARKKRFRCKKCGIDEQFDSKREAIKAGIKHSKEAHAPVPLNLPRVEPVVDPNKVVIKYKGCPHIVTLERPKTSSIYHKPGCVCDLCVPGNEETREGICGHCEHQDGYTGKLRFAQQFETDVRMLFNNYIPLLTKQNAAQHRSTVETFIRAIYGMTIDNANATLKAEYNQKFKDQPKGDPAFPFWYEQKTASIKQIKKLYKDFLVELRYLYAAPKI